MHKSDTSLPKLQPLQNTMGYQKTISSGANQGQKNTEADDFYVFLYDEEDKTFTN